MEESDRVATYAGGGWWQARVAESMHNHDKWCILNAAQHGVPQNRARLWVVGLRWGCLAARVTPPCPTPSPNN